MFVAAEGILNKLRAFNELESQRVGSWFFLLKHVARILIIPVELLLIQAECFPMDHLSLDGAFIIR